MNDYFRHIMLDSVDNEINTAVYRSTDPIRNFQIRVKLERLNSGALISTLSRLKIQDDLEHLLEFHGNGGDRKTPRAPLDYEEMVIGWQEKLFNRLEFDRYGRDLGPTQTSLEQKYFELIRKMKAQRQQPGRIFTYIDGDPYCGLKEIDHFMTDSPNEQPSELALGMDTFRKRRNKNVRVNRTRVVNQRPTDEDLHNDHLASMPCQIMYIMADLSDRIDRATAQLVLLPQPINEQVLCKIKLYSDGTLVMEPDFNQDKMAYIVETGSFSNEVYQYYIENASLPIQFEDLQKERRLMREINVRKQRQLAEIVGNTFDCPSPYVLNLFVFGEIVSSKNFDYDDTYVHYCLDLPDNWDSESSIILAGYTHTARSTSSSRYDDIAYYSYPFEFTLRYEPPPDLSREEFPQMPKIYFQVASHDTWGRHRTEGYTYIDIPSFPGFYDEHLSCWRPRGQSIFEEVRRFFIGSSSELEDLTYVSIPQIYRNDPDQRPLSRFGFRTVTTGSLHIRFHVVFQSQTIAIENARRQVRGRVDRQGFNNLMSSIDVVIGT